ncbi:MAG: beta-glucosidase family protein, partial [Polyangiaceae bacterium]|nr:beta-glucosidase family protein [Polyangiaceae bacterium]
VVFETLDPGVPATLSRRVITDLLKGELGYEGVVISDDLEMKAVSERYGITEAGVRAIEAGCDCLLVCSDVDALLRLRDALVRRAESDAGFAERLRDAAERVLRLARAFPPSTSLEDPPLVDDEAEALAARLARGATA